MNILTARMIGVIQSKRSRWSWKTVAFGALLVVRVPILVTHTIDGLN